MINLIKLTLLLVLLLPVTANAYDFEVNGIYYSMSGTKKAMVTYKEFNLASYSGNVTIPATVTYNGTTYSVTKIGSSAFKYCSGLASVTIPNSVTTIGYGAFYDCSGLTSVTIPNSVMTIGEYAFRGCSGLSCVDIGNSVTTIGYGAFYDCSGLTSVTIPNSVMTIGEYTFYGCI